MAKRGKWIKCTGTVLEALSQAQSEIESLRDEMIGWREKLEENNMDHLPKYEEVDEAARVLEDSELETHVSELEDVLKIAAEGKPFKKGCSPHKPGKPCRRCGWKGNVPEPEPLPKLKLHDPAKKDPFGYFIAASIVHSFGQHSQWAVREGASVKAAHAEAKKKFDAEVAEVKARNAKPNLGNPKPDEPAVPPHEGLKAIATEAIGWQEWRGYGRKALVLSRSDRLGNACSAARAAIEFVNEEIEDLGEDENDERVEEVKTFAEEIEQAIGEVEEVSFPGMY